MRKIRFTVFSPSVKNSTEERIKALERYIVILQRELEYELNSLNSKESE